MKAAPVTPEEICRRLAERFRGRGLYAATRASVASQLDWGERFLADDREGWSVLLLRAQCSAERVSFAEHCRERGWSPRRGRRAWRRAARAIARGLATDIPEHG